MRHHAVTTSPPRPTTTTTALRVAAIEQNFTGRSRTQRKSNSYGGGGGAGGGGNSSSSISDYLTNICPGWRVDDLLFDDAAFSTASKGNDYEHEQVPCLDADLFDVVAGRPGNRGAWYGGALGLEKAPPAAASSSVAVPTAAAKQQQQGRVRERHWSSDSDSDVFAVPEISQQPPAKRARPPAPPSFWCF